LDELKKRTVPTKYEGFLRSQRVSVPECIRKAPGIYVFGRRFKSLAFSTDVAIIKNINSDAIIAVYPFTPQTLITKAIISVADMPVFVGVGGGWTTGERVVDIAVAAENAGAMGVVVNAPTPNETITMLKKKIDIPVIVTVITEHTDIQARLDAGADILNVAASYKTADLVRKIHEQFPSVPIIATGGPTDESILRTIEAGAHAITYTPPTNGELFSVTMDKYRAEVD